MKNSGYTDPVVKLLNPSTTDIQYVSDTVSYDQVSWSVASYSQSDKMGLFIPNQTYHSAISLQNDNYDDIIVNSSTFPMNTNTL
jgi:hypothetical protein